MSTQTVSLLALLTTLLSVALIIVQVLEFLWYRAAPSVWPLVQ